MALGRLHLDFETRSSVDLRRAGVYAYARHGSTKVLCVAWRFDDGPVESWQDNLDIKALARVLQHVAEGGEVVAHNAAFEREIWNHVFLKHVLLPVPELRIEQQDCTLARAAAHGLPLSLESLAEVLGCEQQKDKEGRALMLKMSNYWPDTSGQFAYDSQNMARLVEYCKQDVATECAVDIKLFPLSPSERKTWQLDQTINSRGVRVDTISCRTATAVLDKAKEYADVTAAALTDGYVKRISEIAKIKNWLSDRGIAVDSLDKARMPAALLKAHLLGDDKATRLITLRGQTSKSSTAKFKAMLACVNKDNRARGSLQYHAAATGRWGGRLFQPQNLPRMDYESEGRDVARIRKSLHHYAAEPARALELLTLQHGEPFVLLSRSLRSMLIAGKERTFVGGDFSNIEGRLAAYLCDEHWKTEAFRDFDFGRGADLYKLSYARSFGCDVESVSKAQRQIGKVQELALGYQGSVGAYVSMAAIYGIQPDEVAAIARQNATDAQWLKAREKYTPALSVGLPPETWTGIKYVVDAWRAAHPNVMQSWWDLQDAAILAVDNPGESFECLSGRVKYKMASGFLWCRLPSGRVLAYPSPRISYERVKKEVLKGFEISDNGVDKIPVYETVDTGSFKRQVTYYGVDSQTKKWTKQALYGGLQFNNIVQGLARDVMVSAMFEAEAKGFDIVLTVHDELLCESIKGTLGPEQLREAMAAEKNYVPGLPLAVSTWQDVAYVK